MAQAAQIRGYEDVIPSWGRRPRGQKEQGLPNRELVGEIEIVRLRMESVCKECLVLFT